MQGPVEEEAGRSTSRVRRLATPIEVAAYLQVPVKTCMRGATRGKVLARIELAAISDTVGRMWRHGSRRPQLADETDPALPHSPSWNQQQMCRLLLESVLGAGFTTCADDRIRVLTCGFSARPFPSFLDVSRSLAGRMRDDRFDGIATRDGLTWLSSPSTLGHQPYRGVAAGEPSRGDAEVLGHELSERVGLERAHQGTSPVVVSCVGVEHAPAATRGSP